ncbi:glycosyltransferase family 4 protein [Hydrogenimonas urashimensis]|uniref:glycosyltransferase family 4 protein n=1 Tax=Hydrogenimonas urashimensis TaxID=2740515 RepID=UPI00191658BB|nr:glycosyltransferase family 4 protein [Hydrogenimonas urashimensis]
MNILLEAYACEPHKGSEPEVGWQMANEIAKIFPNDTIHVITKANNQEVIEKESYPPNLKFYYYEPPKWLTFWKKGGHGVRTYYYLWLIGAALFLKKRKIDFDIIHHVTFVNDWLPSYLFLLKNRNNSFIWGPIGSHDPIDPKFLESQKRKTVEKIRIGLQIFFRNFDPAFYICKAKSDCIVGINSNVRHKLGLRKNDCFIAEPAIALKKSDTENIQHFKSESDCFTIVSVGRLMYIKNFAMSLRIFAKFVKNVPSTKAKLQIIGDGEDRKELEKLAKELNIKKNVEFMGNIPRKKVMAQFAHADVFMFPTLENAGFVILEAMAYALPVLAMKYGGPQQFVLNYKDEQLVSPHLAYKEIVEMLAERLETLYRNEDLRKKIGIQNRQDVLEHFTWEAKARKMKDIYTKVLHEKT